MKPEIDRAALAADIKAWLAREGLSTRAATQAHPGINPAMISRACNGHVLAAENLLLLCLVTGADPFKYLIIHDPLQRNQTVTAIVPRETSPRSEDERQHP